MTTGSVRIEVPRCAICDTKVYSLTHERDQVAGDLVFTAHCHGATEETRISASDLQQGDIVALRQGIAFGFVVEGHMTVDFRV